MSDNLHPDKVGRLICLPTSGTLKRLMDVFSTPPMKLDPFETMHVTVARAYTKDQFSKLQDLAEKCPDDQLFGFKFVDVDYFYDQHLGVSKLIGNIECRELQTVKDHFDPKGPPLAIQFLHDAPSLARSIKSFVTSVSDTLVFKETMPFAVQNMYAISEVDYINKFKTHYIGFTGSGYQEQL